MGEKIVWNLFAVGFVLAAMMLFVRAARADAKRSGARRGLGIASIAWACAAALYQHEPRTFSYVAMGAGAVLMLVAAFLSARDG